MYGIGRAEAARFERDSRCFERHSKVLRATQQKGVGAVSVTVPQTVYFRPHGSRGASDLRITPHIRLWRQLVLRRSGTTLLAAASLAFAGSHCVRRFAGSGSYEEGTRQCSRRHSSGCTHIGMVLRH
jgi:hypothetical protein